jgi:hypothetical protein
VYIAKVLHMERSLVASITNDLMCGRLEIERWNGMQFALEDTDWTLREEWILLFMRRQGQSPTRVSVLLGRTPDTIVRQLKEVRLREAYLESRYGEGHNYDDEKC